MSYLSILHFLTLPARFDTWMWVVCVLVAVALLVVTWRDWLIRKQRKRYDEKVRDLVRTLYGIRLPLASIKAPLEELAGQGRLSDEDRSSICTALHHTDSLLELVENLKKEWQMNVWSDEDGIADDELNARLEEIMEFFRLYADEAQEKDGQPPSGCTNCNNELDWKFIASIKKAVEENMDTPGFTVDTLCGMLNMSRTSFYNKLKALTDQSKETFLDDGSQTVYPGTNDKYLEPSSGSGRIEYWACDRTGYKEGNTVCTRNVGGNGDPYVSGAVPGDYWYIYGDLEGANIPAGSKIHFYFVTKLGTMCSNYWMIEFKDGEEWKPALPTSTVEESATETLSGASIDYSATITYNFAGMLLDTSNNGAYISAEGVFTTSQDMEEIVLRFGQAGRLSLNGSKYSGKYIDWIHTSGQTRFSAQHPSDPQTGEAIKEYNEYVLLEIVE